MKTHLARRIPVAAAMGLAVAMLALGFLAALGVRSLVVPTASAEPQVPNPGHSWSEIGDLPGEMWHSENDGSGSGLDADTLDGLNSNEIDDGDDHVADADYATSAGYASSAGSASNASYATSAGNADTANTASFASYATQAGNAGTADSATTASYASDADTVDGYHYDQIQDADDYVTDCYQANRAYAAGYATDADRVDGKHAFQLENRCILCYGMCGNGFNDTGGVVGDWGGGGGAYWYCDLNDYRFDWLPAAPNPKHLCCK